MQIELPITISIDPDETSFDFDETILDALSLPQQKLMWASLWSVAYEMVGKLSELEGSD